jgi:hypothetical protein
VDHDNEKDALPPHGADNLVYSPLPEQDHPPLDPSMFSHLEVAPSIERPEEGWATKEESVNDTD